MRNRIRPARYFPDRPPTWMEIVLGVLTFLSVAPALFSASRPSWSAVFLGSLACGLALGPAAATTFGDRIGQWFRSIGDAGRLAVLMGFGIVLGIALSSDALPNDFLRDAATGGQAALLLYLSAYLVVTREVSGWIDGHGES